VSEAKPFTRHVADIYLVTRLDGYTVEDAIGLIDRGRSALRTGSVVLDQSGTPDRVGDRWLQEAAERLETIPGERVVLERTAAPAASSAPILGYFSWGSNEPATRVRRIGLPFSNGALAGMFVSADGRTFSEPKADWVPGTRPGPDAESLAGDLIREGVTGLAANVSEPFLDATVRPQVLFPAYLSGFNLAESFYLAMPALGWQGIVLGDPLCAPFRQAPIRRADIDKGMDLATELPALFAERRLALLSQTGLHLEGLRIMLLADARLARDEGMNIEPLLKRALEAEPRLTIANLRLAALYETRAEYDKAIAQYHAALVVDPENLIALNNLAYALAERQQKPQEALALAQKAYRLAQAPEIADTLGWVHHLLGDDESAARWLEKAVTDAPNAIDIRVHAAIVHAALNDVARARLELQAAEKLDPRIGERPDVQALRARLKLDVETRGLNR
jgi:tetratricopeptide (TPR) repeat protein